MKHITPKNDLIPHENSTTCKCCPDVHEEHGIVVHSSFDKREYVEFIKKCDIIYDGSNVFEFYKNNGKAILDNAFKKDLGIEFFRIVQLAEKWEDYELAAILIHDLEDE